jgi:DNA polymerase
MQEVEAPWADKTLEEARREKKNSLTVRGVDQNEKWTRFPVYGGSLFNNLVQGTARDILIHGLVQTEEHYGTPSLHTHDEIGVEVRRGSADVKEYESLLSRLPDWCGGLPMASKAFLSKRYKKD